MIPFDVFSASAQPGHEVGVDYVTDNSNGVGASGAPKHVASGNNADAVVTLDKAYFTATGQRYLIGGIFYSYAGSGTLSNGRLLMQDVANSETLLDLDVSSSLKDFVFYSPALRCKPNATITV